MPQILFLHLHYWHWAMSSANDCVFLNNFFLGINYIAEKFDSFDGEEDPYTLAMITYAMHKTSKDKIRSK